MSHSGWSASNYITQSNGTIPSGVPLTIHARAKPSALSGIQRIVSIYFDGSNFLELITSGTTPQVRSTPGGSGGTGTIATGTWYSLTARLISSTSRDVWIDGVSSGSNATSGTPTAPVAIGIGARAGVVPFSGSIADVGIWNVSLAQADIEALAAGVSPLLIRPDALLHYFPLIDSGTLDLMAPAATVTGTLTKDNDHPRVIMPRQRSLIIPKGAGGGSIGSGAGASDGVATVSGAGASLSASVYASTGTATAQATATSTAAAVYSSDGVATVSGVGTSSASGSVYSSAGVATAQATGSSIAAAVYGSGGAATVLAEGSFTGTVSAVFSASGLAIVTGISAAAAESQRRPSAADYRASRRKRRDRETLEAYYAALQRKAHEDAEREKLEALAEAERALEEAETAKKAEAKRAAVRKVFAALNRAAITDKAKAGAREAEQAALQAIANRQTQEQREAYLDALDQLNAEIETIGAQIARLYARRREEEQFLLQRWFAA